MTIQYDASRHLYLKDGKQVPSVTQILAEAGLIDTTWFNDEARDRGTAVAAFTSLDDEGDLDEENELVQPFMGYIRGWQKFREEVPVRILANEEAYYHSLYRYAGTVDRIAGIRGRISIIDIKTGGVYPSYGPQLAGYSEFVRTPKQPQIDRFAVVLKPEGTYRMVEYDKRNDWDVFASALTLWYFKREKGLKRDNSN